MNMRTFSRKIHAACKAWIAQGGKIRPVSESYTANGQDDETCRCPLGALHWVDNPNSWSYPCANDMHSIGMSPDDAAKFACTFDNRDIVDAGGDKLKALAIRCRKMYAK